VGHQDIRPGPYITTHAFVVFDAEQGFEIKARTPVQGSLSRGKSLKFPQGDPGVFLVKASPVDSFSSYRASTARSVALNLPHPGPDNWLLPPV
jgi:hypothetical protein